MNNEDEFKDLRYQDIVAEFNALADYGDGGSAGEYIGDLAKTFYAMRDHNTALRSENKEIKASRRSLVRALEFSLSVTLGKFGNWRSKMIQCGFRNQADEIEEILKEGE